jgi:transposase
MNRPVKKVRTLQERLKIVEEVEKNPIEKRVDVAKRLGISASTLNSIVSKKDEIREQIRKCGKSSKTRKTSKESKYAELEQILFTWYQQSRAVNIPIDGCIIREKAKQIAVRLAIDDFAASNGWISRFKDRHGLVYKKLAGESASVDPERTSLWINELPKLLEGYEPRDIYNADETGLFYNCLPDGTLTLKGESCHGGKASKERISVLFCVNSDGTDMREPLVIGKSLKPRCFKNTKTLPVKYYANKKAWMTTNIFELFLRDLDSEMRIKRRNILLFVDNCAAHPPHTTFLKM